VPNLIMRRERWRRSGARPYSPVAGCRVSAELKCLCVPPPSQGKRFFARMVSSVSDHIPSEFERLLVEAFNALYLAIGAEEQVRAS
jgi:hypothetical protein